MTSPIRVAVADDHHLFRAGVLELLQTDPDLEIVGEAATGVEAITLCRQTAPDVLLLDVEMPGPGAAAVIHKIVESGTRTRVVILTMHDDPVLVRTLVAAGASGFLLKTAGRSELIAAVRTAARNADTLLIAVSRATVAGLYRPDISRGASVLTARESEVLRVLAEGRSNREIARTLSISDATVKRHLANIYAKLGTTSRLEAVTKAVQQDLLADAPTRA